MFPPRLVLFVIFICCGAVTSTTMKMKPPKGPDGTTKGLEYLSIYMNISDSSFTASSEWGCNHEAHRVRIDRYMTLACSWSAAGTDKNPWLQFDMGIDVTVWGVIMKPRCDNPQKVTSYQMGHSENGVTWSITLQRVTPDYSVDGRSITWLPEPTKGRYWRINVLTWSRHPSMKADLIGKGKKPQLKALAVTKCRGSSALGMTCRSTITALLPLLAVAMATQ